MGVSRPPHATSLAWAHVVIIDRDSLSASPRRWRALSILFGRVRAYCRRIALPASRDYALGARRRTLAPPFHYAVASSIDSSTSLGRPLRLLPPIVGQMELCERIEDHGTLDRGGWTDTGSYE